MQFIDTINVKGTDYQFQATYDAQGNEIASTYATLEAVEGIVSDAIADLVDSAPDTLNTLQELANALGGDENFSATITGEIGKKANSSDVYTKSEIDGLKQSIDADIRVNFDTLSGLLVKKADESALLSKADIAVVNSLSDDIKTKANISDVYSKAAADTTFALRTSIPTIPTEISTFNNDAGYLVSDDITDLAKSADVNSALEGKVDKIDGYSLLSDENLYKIAALPNVDQYNYKMNELNVAISNMSTNINQALQENDDQDLLIQANTTALENKIDKAEGMGLSSNDYTTEDKELLQDLKGRVEALESATAVLEQKSPPTSLAASMEAKISRSVRFG